MPGVLKSDINLTRDAVIGSFSFAELDVRGSGVEKLGVNRFCIFN